MRPLSIDALMSCFPTPARWAAAGMDIVAGRFIVFGIVPFIIDEF